MHVCTYRYVVRVVSADLDNNVTNVQWVTPNDAVSGSQMVNRGRFVEIYNTLASQPMKVECDHPCLVMLYNTGEYPTVLMSEHIEYKLHSPTYKVLITSQL